MRLPRNILTASCGPPLIMGDAGYHTIDSCRVCQSASLKTIHDFSRVPLADKLTDSPDEAVPSANLSIAVCNRCYHLQIRETVDPVLLFKEHYPYLSSRIPEVVRHFEGTHRSIRERIHLDPEDTVLEIAANDGVLLKHFQEDHIRVLGIEPSLAPAAEAEKLGIPVLKEFFTLDVARELRKNLPGQPRLILGNNVMAHVPDPLDFAMGVEHILADSGTAVFEVPVSRNMIADCTFDVIIHQHYSYFNLHSLSHLFGKAGLYINTIESIPTQGGSLRLFISRDKRVTGSVTDFLALERESGLLDMSTYARFSSDITACKESLMKQLGHWKQAGKKVAGYGAPGKAATMLNYFGINTDYLEYLVDISDTKHYKYFPFTGLRIFPVDHLDRHLPDVVLILAWNYADSIARSLERLRKRGVRFAVPYPSVREV